MGESPVCGHPHWSQPTAGLHCTVIHETDMWGGMHSQHRLASAAVLLAMLTLLEGRMGDRPGNQDRTGVGEPHTSDVLLPEFDPLIPANLTVQQGDTAYLSCRILNIGNRSVSWVRGRDSHIITVDEETFISDGRFLSLKKTKELLWTLKIKYVSARDAGKYECQVSSSPKMSRWIDLVVVVPKVRIFGGPDIYVREGSSLQLECVISQTIVSPKFVVWEYNGDLVPGSSFIKVQDSPSTSSSTLSVGRVTRYQAGNYSCHPDNLHPATISLHVLSKDGEHLPITGSEPWLHSPPFLVLVSTLYISILL